MKRIWSAKTIIIALLLITAIIFVSLYIDKKEKTDTTDNFFEDARLKRQEYLEEAERRYNDIIASEGMSEKGKQAAVDGLMKLYETKEAESIAEILIKAKGYGDALVFIQEMRADVIVCAEKLTEAELEQIMDIVKEESGMKKSQIHITLLTENK